jgi:membrane-associated phospholipid phosphatase
MSAASLAAPPTTADSIPARLRQMLLGWGCVGLIYFPTGLLQLHAFILTESPLDRLIAYNPGAVWLYLSFFALIPYAYMTAPFDRVQRLARAMQLCAVGAGSVFLLFPTTLAYPPVPPGEGAGAWLLARLLEADSPHNCLPSLHAALTALCVWALYERDRPLRSALVLLLGVAICYSVIALRRHLAIDLAAGLLLAIAGAMLAAKFTRPKGQP